MTVEVFRDAGATLVESIWWDPRTDEVVWVDILAGTVHRGPWDGATDGSDDRVVTLEAPVSAVQPGPDGGYVATSRERILSLDASGRPREVLAEVRHPRAGIRFNEGKVDPFGAFVVGTMDADGHPPAGAVYRLSGDGLSLLRGGFGITNGMEWVQDGRTFLLTDTTAGIVYRASYDGSGTLGELTPLLEGHSFDGLTRAEDGTLWNAVHGDGVVLQWSGAGELLSSIRLPAPQVTSVAFAGPGLEHLLVGSSRENMSDADVERRPMSGAIFRIAGVGRGFAPYTFSSPDPSELVHIRPDTPKGRLP